MEHEHALVNALGPTWAVESTSGLHGSSSAIDEFLGRSGLVVILRVHVIAPRIFWLLVLMIVTCVWAGSSFAQTSASVGMQVRHDSWAFQDGAPEEIYALAQTNDGFLWLGSETGLVRFDGLRFEPFRSPFGDQLLSTGIYALFAPPSGGLWIGYQNGGFSFVDHGRVTNYEPQPTPGSSTGGVLGFAEDRDGIVWAATPTGVWRFNRSSWERIGAEWNAPKDQVHHIGLDSAGILWVLSGPSFYGPLDLYFLMPGTTEFRVASKNVLVDGFSLRPDRTVVTESPPDSLKNQSVGQPSAPVLRKNSFLADRNNGAWFSQDQMYARIDAGERLADAMKKASLSNSETYNVDPYVGARLVDREGNIWFGTSTRLHRFFYSPLTKQELSFGKLCALGDTLEEFALAPGDDGAIWIATTGCSYLHLYRVLEGKVTEALPKLKNKWLSFAYRAPDKALWLGGEGGIWRLTGSTLVRVVLPPELAKQTTSLQAITQDQHEGMWISFGRRGGLYRLADGVWTPYGGRTDIPKTKVLSEFTDSLGRVWFGYEKNQLAVLDGDRVRVFGPNDGVKVGKITAIYGRGGGTWIGGTFGLQQVDSGRIRSVSALDRQLFRGISGIVETASGDVWLNSISGIIHLASSELSEAVRNPSYQLKGQRYGRRAELPGFPQQLRPLQTAIETSNGKLWFAGTKGVVWLDPRHVRQEAPPPPIIIESLSADGRSHEVLSPLTLPARTGSVQINYAAVSLSDPEGTHFRYKLQETDKDWNEAAEATPVTYRNLTPGSYHFSIEASNTNDAWSEVPANIAFTILPAFYQTNWFRLLCVVLFIALLWALYRWRIHRLTSQEERLRDVVETIPAMTFTTSSDGSSTFVNKTWTEYTGLSVEQSSGTGWQRAVYPEDFARYSENWRISVATGQLFEDEARFRRAADGEYRWFLVRGVPLRDHHGKTLRWYGTLTDIEDRKRAEQEHEKLRHLEADLAHVNRVSMLGEMAASLAHEIKQPIAAAITSANSCIEWLAHEPPNLDRARAAANKIDKYGNRAAEIIDRIRSFYKKSPPEREFVDVNGIVDEIVTLLECEATRCSVATRTELAAEVPRIMADRVQLRQVFMNLMLNAIEAMKDSGGDLTVTSQLQDRQLLFSVSDTGVGLPVEKMDQIFSAFFTTKPQGSGMGLAISRSIVESHGGRLWANANDGQGATFHFTLPIQVIESSPSVA